MKIVSQELDSCYQVFLVDSWLLEQQLQLKLYWSNGCIKIIFCSCIIVVFSLYLLLYIHYILLHLISTVLFVSSFVLFALLFSSLCFLFCSLHYSSLLFCLDAWDMIKSEENKLTWEGSKSENEDEKVDDRGNNKEAREVLALPKELVALF